MGIPASAPSQASAVGYTQLLFGDDFTSLSTIDVSDTFEPGFNWYVNIWNQRQSNVVSPGDYSVAGSNLTINCSVNSSSYRARIMSGTTRDNGTNLIGRFVNPRYGMYIETGFAFDPANALGGQNAWPAVWLQDYRIYQRTSSTINPMPANCGPFPEVDVCDFVSIGTGTFDPFLGSIHDWLIKSDFSQAATDSDFLIPGTPTWTNQNAYGVLIVPMAQGGGTGSLARYFNNTLESTVTWTPGGNFTDVETGQFILTANGGPSYPIIIDYIAIWGLPGTNIFYPTLPRSQRWPMGASRA